MQADQPSNTAEILAALEKAAACLGSRQSSPLTLIIEDASSPLDAPPLFAGERNRNFDGPPLALHFIFLPTQPGLTETAPDNVRMADVSKREAALLERLSSLADERRNSGS